MNDVIIIDAGSAYVKAQLLTENPNETQRLGFSSVVSNLGTNPPDIPSTHDPFDGDGFIFRWNGQYWAVGSVAEQANGRAIRGGRRYTTVEWKALIAGVICALVPESSEIRLNVAVPLRGGDAAERTITTDLRTTFRTKLYNTEQERGNTGQRTVDVVQVQTMHETEGAYFFYLLDENGEPRPDVYYQDMAREVTRGVQDLFEYGLILVDGGGWSLDALPVNGLHPNFGRAVTLRGNYGLGWVNRWLSDELQSHPEVGGGAEWPQHVLEAALLPEYTRRGTARFYLQFGRERIEIRDYVERATSPLCNAVAEWVTTALDGGRDNAWMLLTGGAAGAMYPWMTGALKVVSEELGIRNHVVVMEPDTDTPTYFHNVEGMARFMRRKLNRL